MMIRKMKERLVAFHKDERGAMSTEMILIMAIVAVPVLILLYEFVKNYVIPWFTTSRDQLINDHG